MVSEPSSAGNVASMSRQIEQAREKLLDLGLRNSLVNYRPLRTRGVEVVDELPAEIFQMLVLQSRRMSFDPAPDAEGQGVLALAQPEEDPSDGLAARHADQRLQTSLPSAQLQSKLLSTYYAARTSIEEQGVNVLFLALGMLEWYESASSQEPRKAPLVLVPVELTRSNALDRFHLSYTGEEIGANLSIEAKLKTEFNVQLPAMAATEDLDVDAYFAEVETAMSFQARWRVDRGGVALGFFSFGKFLMYRDLDLTTWPAELQPTEHPILRSLLGDGFNEPASAIGENAFLDPLMKDMDIHQVVDADSSQTATILDAIHGRNLVVQGPPGTGKSQTITNIIAEAIGAGKTVLFVAEKMAALEVVKRRLDSVGLGDACLELHSNKINKRSVVQELRRTLELGRPRVDTLLTELTLLESHRSTLNDYCDAINTPIGETAVTPYEAYGELINIGRPSGDAEWPRVDLPGVAGWTDIEFVRRRALVEQLQARTATIGDPVNHPFWGVRRAIPLLPTEQSRLRTLLPKTHGDLQALRQFAATLSENVQMPPPLDVEETERLLATYRRAANAPTAPGVAFSSTDWLAEHNRLSALFDSGEQWMEIRQRRQDDLKTEAWDRNMQPLRDTLAEYQSKWWRAVSGTYRAARSELSGYCTGAVPDSVEDQLQLVDDVIDALRLASVVEEHDELASRLFGPYWKRTSSDWAQLRSWTEWSVALHEDVCTGRYPSGLTAYLETNTDRMEIKAHVDDLISAMATCAVNREDIRALTEFDSARRFRAGETLHQHPYAVQQTLIQSWVERIDEFHEMIAFNVSVNLCSEEELGAVVKLAQEWPGAGQNLTGVYRWARYEALLEKALRERQALSHFDGHDHERAIARFRELDLLMFKHNRARLALAHYESLPSPQGSGQIGVLRKEFEKKSRHFPVRKLIGRAGNAVQAIKPVFMMSPLSIATYIPPGTVTFDLVIFDEASQVKPVDAFGALLRGKQTIVVGDSKQLPPTTFFDALTTTDEDEDESATSDIESILGLFSSAGAPQRMLRWHYRSRHESLITVSNHEFYENRLVLFPSPDASRENSGLIFHYHPDTVYQRAKSTNDKPKDGEEPVVAAEAVADKAPIAARTSRQYGISKNPKEALIVAQAVMKHARTSPELTLGVAAFSKAQADEVRGQVETLRRQDPLCEAFFHAHPHEPFFVKNLENVQGDERDIMFISVGYGRDENNKVSMNFGPLNGNGGERRLNVLITRARRRCEVFTNLTADDIKSDRTQARGVASFQRFLKYAQTGVLDVPRETGLDFGSPFEEAVYSALTEQGYRLDKQVGSAGFFIDLAVVDPRKPGRYLLAIECDGATYHSARSARDRDRLRQQVLEGLGWHVHRIWSTDWFRHPERELKRTIAAIEDAKAREPANIPVSPVVRAIDRGAIGDVTQNSLRRPKYVLSTPVVQTYGRDLHLVQPHQIALWIAQVVQVEGPVHHSEVAKRIAAAAGVGRVGNRIRSAIQAGIRHASFGGKVHQRGDFLWAAGTQPLLVRDRSDLPNAARSIELIAPEELDVAVESVVKASYGIDLTDVPPEACRLLGFQRVTGDMREVVNARIEQLVAAGRLTQQGTHLMIVVS